MSENTMPKDAMPKDYERFMQEFVAAWCNKDLEALMGCFTDDAEYNNVPMPPINKGKDEIRAFIEGFLGSMDSIEFVVHRQVVNGDTVMNERTDHIVLNGKKIALPVMGVFEFREGKIARWWDYFDMGPFSG
ncbi:limonene-1,2-epoxide hydrolase [Litorivivens lipolytica]|uniref:Limonene-1,2-epoxide hydrolase n=1 Tax=Litorivivens lipolytica TaxID=1524264 RepID=A0A7W4W3K0_9GAMM|nr:nuclear transport factor 2 family protein [Litorivivens lipolytica]MBB3046807.1 limonene-1,2-epoxide hydrolase [Litorivivens lipolytica]